MGLDPRRGRNIIWNQRDNISWYPAIISEDWLAHKLLDNKSPVSSNSCWYYDTEVSVFFSHGCIIKVPIDLDHIYNYGNNHFSNLLYDDEMQFQVSFFLQRVDNQKNRSVEIYFNLELDGFFSYPIYLNSKKLSQRLNLTFSVPIPEFYREVYFHPENYQSRLVTTNYTVYLTASYSVIFEENVIPTQQLMMEDSIFLDLSELHIRFLPQIPKFPLSPRNSEEAAEQNIRNISIKDSDSFERFLDETPACDLLGFPDASTLNLVEIVPPSYLSATMNPQRIFCGIYSTAKQHGVNVKVSFIAFSVSIDRLTKRLTNYFPAGCAGDMGEAVHFFLGFQHRK